jgi:methionyl-tRNA formyltransferase
MHWTRYSSSLQCYRVHVSLTFLPQDGATPIVLALEAGHEDNIVTLIQLGADLAAGKDKV